MPDPYDIPAFPETETRLPQQERSPLGQRSPYDIPAFPPNDRDPLARHLAQAREVKPETAAQIATLQSKTGLPPELIARNLDEVQQATEVANFNPEQFRATYPKMTQWLLRDRLNAQAAQEDYERLGALEHTLAAGTYAVRRFQGSMWESLSFGLGGMLHALGENLGNPELAAWGKSYQENRAAQAAGWAGEAPKNSGLIEQLGYGTADIIGNLIPLIAVEALSGGGATPALGAEGLAAVEKVRKLGWLAKSLIASQATGGFYSRARESGLDPLPALAVSGIIGYIEQKTESPQIEGLFEDALKGTKFFKFASNEVVRELKGEEIAQLTQGFTEWATMRAPHGVTFTDWVQEQLPEGAGGKEGSGLGGVLQTALLTVLASGVTAAGGRTVGRLIGATQALAGEQMLTTIGPIAKEIALRERSQAQFTNYVESLAEGTPVKELFFDSQTWQTYWQTHDKSGQQVAEQLGISKEDYQTALEAGHPITVPLAQYVTHLAATAHNGVLANEVRVVSPNNPNAREIAAWVAAQDAAATERGIATVEGPPTAQQAAQTAFAQQLRDRLTNRAGMTVQDAETNAALVSAFVQTFLTERANLDPAKMLQRRMDPRFVERVVSAESIRTSPGLTPEEQAQEGPLTTPPAPPVGEPALGEGMVAPAPVEAPAAPAAPAAGLPAATPPPVSAAFLAYGPDGPLFNIVGGPKHGSTVGQAALQPLGLEQPELPPDTGERLNGDQLRAKMLEAQATPAPGATYFQTEGAVAGGPVPADLFFSGLLKAVEETKMAKASGDQWIATLKNAKGVKQADVDVLALEALAGSTVYTKQQVTDFLTQNLLQVEVTDLHDGDTPLVRPSPVPEVVAEPTRQDYDTMEFSDEEIEDELRDLRRSMIESDAEYLREEHDEDAERERLGEEWDNYHHPGSDTREITEDEEGEPLEESHWVVVIGGKVQEDEGTFVSRDDAEERGFEITDQMRADWIDENYTEPDFEEQAEESVDNNWSDDDHRDEALDNLRERARWDHRPVPKKQTGRTEFSSYRVPGPETNYHETFLQVPKLPPLNSLPPGQQPEETEAQQFRRATALLGVETRPGADVSVTEIGDSGDYFIFVNGVAWKDPKDNQAHRIYTSGQRTQDEVLQLAMNHYQVRREEALAKATGPEPRPTWEDGHDDYEKSTGGKNPWFRVRWSSRQTSLGNTMWVHELQPPTQAQMDLMMPALRDNWRPAAIKFVLRTAAEQGYDAVAFSNGQDQVNLYKNIEKEVKSIRWAPAGPTEGTTPDVPEGHRSVVVTMRNSSYPQWLIYNIATGTVTEASKEEWVQRPGSVKKVPRHLIEVLGKPVFDQIEAMAQETWGRHGGGLKGRFRVGGIGLRNLYDKGIPSDLRDNPWVKKSKTKPTTAIVATMNNLPPRGVNNTRAKGIRFVSDAEDLPSWSEVTDLVAEGHFTIELSNGTPWGNFDSEREAQDALDDFNEAADAYHTYIANGMGAPRFAIVMTPELSALALTPTTYFQTAEEEPGPVPPLGVMLDNPAFAAWFKDSVVTEPQYHAGGFNAAENPIFWTQGLGAHFGTKRASEDRADAKVSETLYKDAHDSLYAHQENDGLWYYEWDHGYAGDVDGQPSEEAALSEGRDDIANYLRDLSAEDKPELTTTAVWLSIQHPLVLPDLGTWPLLQTVDSVDRRIGLTADEKRAATEPGEAGWDGLKAALKAHGYDGVVYRNIYEDKGSDSYIAFDPEQIKSATANTGGFNPNEPSILLQQEPKAGEKLAAFSIDASGKGLVSLFRNANLTSFQHEGAHAMLELIGDTVEELRKLHPDHLTESQRDVLREYETVLLPFLGVTSRAEIDRPQHEKFASAWEDFLQEGKAPSEELRPVFARMKAWFIEAFKRVGRKSKLAPEIRRYMNRLVATDEALAQAQLSAEQTPVFTTAEQMGKNPEEFALYRKAIEDAHLKMTEALAAQLRAQEAREKGQQYLARKAVVREAVEAQVRAQPVYRALAAVREGTNPDGTPFHLPGTPTPEEAVPLKFNRKALVELIGEGKTKTLPRPYLYTRDGGITPTALHGLFAGDFPSPVAMIEAMANAPKAEQVIEQETERLLHAEFPNMLDDGSVFDRAQDAVASTYRDKVIRAEIAAFTKLRKTVAPHVRLATQQTQAAADKVQAGLEAEVAQARRAQREGPMLLRETVPPAKAIATVAQQQIARLTVNTINPQLYWAAARRMNKLAVEAAAAQEFDSAIRANVQQLLNLALYREAKRVIHRADELAEQAQRLDTAAARRRIGKAGHTYQDQIDGILDRYEFAHVSQAALDRRAGMREWATAIEAQGRDVGLTDAQLDDTRRINYRELTLPDLQDVVDTLKQIEHLAATKNKLLTAQDARAFSEQRDQLVDSIREHGVVEVLPFQPSDTVGRTAKVIFAQHRKVAMLARSIDGHQDGGPMWAAVSRLLNQAADAERERSIKESKVFRDILKRHYQNTQALQQVRTVAGRTMTHENALAVGLNWGTQLGQDRLLTDPVRRLTPEDVQAILDSLDANDWSFIEAVWAFNGTFWPEIAAQQKRVTGVAPERVEGIEIKTRFGTIQGGYYHLAADRQMSPGIGQHIDATLAEQGKAAAYVRTTTRQGHVETRRKDAQYAVKLDLSVQFAHLHEVIHSLTHQEVLIDVTRMVRDREVMKAIVETRGVAVYDQFAALLADIATGPKPSTNVIDWAMDFAKGRTQVAGLALNTWTAIQQPAGLFNGMQRVGAGWVMRGLKNFLKDPAAMQATMHWIAANSLMMNHRMGAGGEQNLQELRNEFTKAGWYDRQIRRVTGDRWTQQAMAQFYLRHIGFMQRIADVPTWLGQYEKSMAAGLTEPEAFAQADQAVLDSQGGGDIKDLATIQRGQGAHKAYTTFYSYGSTVLNSATNAVEEHAGQGRWREPSSVLTLMWHMSLLYVLPAIYTVSMAGWSGKDDDEDDTWGDWFEKVASESASSALNGVVILREFTSAVLGGARGYAGPAGAQLMSATYSAVQQATQGELAWDTMEKRLTAAGKVAGVILLLPVNQVTKTFEGGQFMWAQGSLWPAGAVVPLAPLVVGPPRKKR